MKWLVLLIFNVSLLVIGCSGDISSIVNLGYDTMISQDETLTLDAGVGFNSYSWNNGLSSQQTFKVTKAGTYWVKVKNNGRTSTDTIRVGMYQKLVACDTTVDVFNYTLDIPCSYKYVKGHGDDSWFFDIQSPKQDIVLDNEIGALIKKTDTLLSLPNIYKSTHTQKLKLVKNKKEIGILFFKKTKASFRPIEGFFLVKEKSYYLESMSFSCSENKKNEVAGILSTFKKH